MFVDRGWVNIAVKLQKMELRRELDWKQVRLDAGLLQTLSSTDELDGIPHTCTTCGEPITDPKSVIRSCEYESFSAAPSIVYEKSFHCRLCNAELAYWAHGQWLPYWSDTSGL